MCPVARDVKDEGALAERISINYGRTKYFKGQCKKKVAFAPLRRKKVCRTEDRDEKK